MQKQTSDKRCIVVNMFGGPGCGKSTGAAYVFAMLKMHGVNCELSTEFAKDKTWESNNKALECQPYVFGKQCYRLDRCADQVDVIVTDSPLFLSMVYNRDIGIENEFSKMVLKKFNEFDNINFFLKRLKEYNPKGRSQTLEEAKQLDEKIERLLKKSKITYKTVDGNIDGYHSILVAILEKISQQKLH